MPGRDAAINLVFGQSLPGEGTNESNSEEGEEINRVTKTPRRI